MVVGDIAQELMRQRVLVPRGIQRAFVSLLLEFSMYIFIYLRVGASFISAYLAASSAIVLRLVFCFLPFCFLRFVYPAKQLTQATSVIVSVLWFIMTTVANAILAHRIGMFGHSLICSVFWIANGYRIMTTDRRRFLYSPAYDATLAELENIHSQGNAVINYVESGVANSAFASGEMPQKQFENTMKAYNLATSESHKLEDEIESLRKQLEWEIKQ